MAERTSDPTASASEATLDPRTPLSPEATALDPDRVHALYETGRELLEQQEPEAVRATIRRAVVRTLRPDSACLLTVANGRFHPVFAHGFDADLPFDRWAVSHTVLQRVLDTGLAVLATDTASDGTLRDVESVQTLRIRSILCVPLGSPPRALLYLDRRGARSLFARHDLAFLTALSVYMNLVLERAESLARTCDALDRTTARWEALSALPDGEAIVGRARSLLGVMEEVSRFAHEGARMLLLGESGTGKELFARLYARGAGKAIVPVAIPTLAPGLVESELFGHVRGAFPGAVRDKVGLLEAAEDGVLFLDEIGDTHPAIQSKLLRFLESGELRRVGDTRVRSVRPSIVAGTNRPLEEEVRAGRFRGDLLARLGHVVRLPPLRERREDIPTLVEHFARLAAHGRQPKAFTAEALAALARYDWPLNVRELRQVVERVTCLVPEPTVRAEHLPDFVRASSTSAPAAADALPGVASRGQPCPMDEILADARRRHLLATLTYTQGNKAEAIRLLGISNDTFYRWTKELGIS